jgi:hypothetical protein
MVTKKICAYCQTPLKNISEEISCPSCNTFYHKDCWNENRGCAVYGCDNKNKITEEENCISLKDVLVNIEYLINQNKYEEAILEAKTYLRIYKNNSELKALYNKAVAFINSKLKLIENAEVSFEEEDYTSSQVYYANALKYTDENESNLIRAKLEVLNQRIPVQRKRKIINRVMISSITIIILAAILYLGYYLIVLKEDREYAELEKDDNTEDVREMEIQIAKYENFLRKYRNGRKYNDAQEKINKFSFILAEKFSNDDWRSGLNYLNKITYSPDIKSVKDLRSNIELKASEEYKKNISNASKLNAVKKFSEAINELNKAIAVADYFPQSEFFKNITILRNNIELLNKKISYLVKNQSLEKEIIEYESELSKKTESATEGRNSVYLSIRINDEIEPGVYVGYEIGSRRLIAISSPVNSIETGELYSSLGFLSGNYNYINGDENKIIPLYSPSSETGNSTNYGMNIIEREAINERLKNLRYQKQKLDSILNLKLK